MTHAESIPYAPLHIHSQYTLLEGAGRPADLLQFAATHHLPAMALTDSGVLYGAIEWVQTAKAKGIQPILGCELGVIDGDITDKSARKPVYATVLLCQNWIGYQNLVRLVSQAQLDGFYYRPRTSFERLAACCEGLIALSGPLSGAVAYNLLRGAQEEAQQRLGWFKDVFADRYYLQLFDHGLEAEARVNAEMLRLSSEFAVPTVLTHDVRFTHPEDFATHEILLCLRDGKLLGDPHRNVPFGAEWHMKTGAQLLERFTPLLGDAEARASLARTLEVAQRCNFKLPLGETRLPDFPLPEGETLEGYLRHVVETHARQRFGQRMDTDPNVQKRLDFELSIINQMGFPAYFLIVWDFIHYARRESIPVGPGRGSAAGSLVAYVLGITNIDPLEHNLLFERFLNPERVSMPDIDIDFCIDRRERVIQYVSQRYGRDHVCQIATFGTMAARAAVKAVARVLDIPFADSDKLAKLIPATPGTKLKDALEGVTEMRQRYDNEDTVRHWLDLALSIEGLPQSIGMHAAGVVISKDPLHQIVPLQNSKDGQVVSQYPMGDLEKLGMLKMDFLGLRNLTIIDHTLALISKRAGQLEASAPLPDMDHLPLDDPGVYEMLSAGDTDGVFQLESGGMKALVRDLKPTTFEDINALVALFRPGPLNSGMVKSFVDRKHGRAKVEYPHPDLEPILKDTYGTIVYQEQIMQVAQTLAGYSLGQADLLRRAMGKKKADVMAQERDGFVQGAVANGVDETVANQLFDTMSEFAAYCFNRSHSAAYAMVAFQTAYLKVHYPVEYLCALLSSVSSDLDKIRLYMQTARRMGIAILPPDVNASGLNFSPDYSGTPWAIRFGLASIKNVGVGVVESLIAARKEKPFATLEDFCQRVDPKLLNKKTLESLISCGALASFGYPRRQLLANIDEMTQYSQRVQQQKALGQVSLFSLLGDDASSAYGALLLSGPAEEFPDGEIQTMEKTLLGFYVTSHPLDAYRASLPLLMSHTLAELKDLEEDAEVIVGGLIAVATQKTTKTNRLMLVGQLEDLSSQVEFVAFHQTLERVGALLTEGQAILFSAKVQFRGDDADTVSLIVQHAQPLREVQPLEIPFAQPPRYEDLAALGRILAEHRPPRTENGNSGGVNSYRRSQAAGEVTSFGMPVILRFGDGTRIRTGPAFWVASDKRALLLGRLGQSPPC